MFILQTPENQECSHKERHSGNGAYKRKQAYLQWRTEYKSSGYGSVNNLAVGDIWFSLLCHYCFYVYFE